MSDTLLTIEDLRVRFPGVNGYTEAVRGLSFTLGRERLGIVGESGSGKSMTGRAILDLVPPPGEVTAKRMNFMGLDLLSLPHRERRALRGARMSMIMQDPKYSLNPVMTVGEQIAETWRIHHPGARKEARERALAMLDAVKIRDPNHVYDLYPHEVSGGMGQRVMIAMVLVADPDLIIADEPTSALDVTVSIQVLSILDDLVSQRGLGLIFISHDLDLVRSFCDRVIVMYGGAVMETLAARDLDHAQHAYTKGLLNCLPRLDRVDATLPVFTRDPEWLK
jgi:peptide/nickel transport system ATP-binding protein